MIENLVDLIPEEEKELIADWIDQCADSVYSSDVPKVLHLWGEKKTNLYNLLGGKLIHEFKVECRSSIDQLAAAWNANSNARIQEFFDSLDRIIWNLPHTERLDGIYLINFLEEPRYFLQENFNEMIIHNRRFPMPYSWHNGKSLCVRRQDKPIRILQKIAEAWKLPFFKDVQDLHSQLMTHRELAATVKLSIHPLDFMTMSESDEWSSCMKWSNWHTGCYRSGTVEMMNSPYVMTAYIESENDIPNLKGWKQKHMRGLFIYHPQIIADVRMYPYRNNELSRCIIQEIKRLNDNNMPSQHFHNELLSWDNDCRSYDSEYLQDNNIQILLTTEGHMYNDYGREGEPHWCYITDRFTQGTLSIDYCGKFTCMTCGAILDYDEYEDGSLCCPNHDKVLEHTPYCECCGNRIPEDRIYEIDGLLYCEQCYMDNAYHCIDDDEYHLNAIEVWLNQDNGYSNYYAYLSIDCNVEEYFPNARCTNKYNTSYVVDYEDATEEELRYFDFY